MSYPRVIALLDAQLERLRTARGILTSSPEETHKADEAVAQVQVEESAGLAAQEKPVPEPRRVAPKQRRERRVVARRKKVPEESALGKAIPPAPVYVSAVALKSARAEKDGAAEALAQKGEALTPEMLSRRWLSPNS